MECKIITNDLIIHNTRSLKNRSQFEVRMEVERSQLYKVMPLEEFPEGTHFEVIIRPYQPEEILPHNANQTL